jgi:hypothetical protein
VKPVTRPDRAYATRNSSRRSSESMNGKTQSTAYARFISVLCVYILCAILVAGLWPFHAPKNETNWLENKNGLQFGRHGSILSARKFQAAASNEDTSGSLEVWLEPSGLHKKQTILAFDSSEHLGDPFSVVQREDALLIQRYNVDNQGISRTAVFEVPGVFRAQKSVFATITLGRGRTSVYIDGAPALLFPILGASANNLTGRLVLANATTANNSWSGDIFGVAIYQKELTAAQVRQHYESWRVAGKPEITYDEAPVAIYLFNERRGRIVHNQLDVTTDLLLPTHYFVLHPSFLAPAWLRYRYGWPGWSYWQDVLVNIVGFVPVGFLLLNYLSVVRPLKRPVATAIILGLLLSLAIETLQSFLPTRDSDMTDLITNTLGTAVGVILYRCPLVQVGWARVTPYRSDVPAHLQTLVTNGIRNTHKEDAKV